MNDAPPRKSLSCLRLIPKEPTVLDGKPLIAVDALVPLSRFCKALRKLLRRTQLIVPGVGIDPDGAWCICLEYRGHSATFEGLHPTTADGFHALLDAFALVAHPIQGDSTSSSISSPTSAHPANKDFSRMTGNALQLHKTLYAMTEQASVHIGGIERPVEPVQKSNLVAPAPTTTAEIDNREFVVGDVAATFDSLIDTTIVLKDRRQVLLPNKLVGDASALKRVQHKLRRHTTADVFIDREGEIERELLSLRQARKKASESRQRGAARAKDISPVPGVDRPGTRKRSKR